MKTLLSILCVCLVHVTADDTLTLKATIPLPEVTGRFDHFAIDVAGRRLFVAALGNNTVEVLDLKEDKRLKTLGGLRKPTGVTFLPERNQIGVAAGGDGIFRVFSGDTYAPISTVSELDDADNVRLDLAANRIFVGFGSGALAVIDAKDFRKKVDIKLAAHPESFQIEKNGKRIFVNIPDAKQVAVVDRDKAAVVKTWPMAKYRANFPMALDERGRRLFTGCRQPARLVVLNIESGTEIANVEVSGDTDDLFYDAKRNRVYLSCGAGFLDVVSTPSSDKFERVSRITTREGARTCFFSTDLDQLFVAVPNRNGAHAEIQIFQPE